MIGVMTGELTANIIDTHTQQPATGVRFQLYWVETHGDVLLRAGVTNNAGTTDAPLLDPAKMSAGAYKLVLHVGDYFESAGVANPKSFLDLLAVVFVIEDASMTLHLEINISTTGYSVQRA